MSTEPQQELLDWGFVEVLPKMSLGKKKKITFWKKGSSLVSTEIYIIEVLCFFYSSSYLWPSLP